MRNVWIELSLAAFCFTGCHSTAERPVDGMAIERQILSDNHLGKDFASLQVLNNIINDVNCADSAVLQKRLVLSEQFHSWDTSEILLIPFISNGEMYASSAYSDVDNRIVLINPTYIRRFSLKNTLNDTISYIPVLELMLLHEMGHFLLKEPGAFDQIANVSPSPGETGELQFNTQPEFLTTIKKVELAADSFAIDFIKRKLASKDYTCLNIAFDVERILPGMQFQLAGTRLLDGFGNPHVGFLHDPSNDHPNLELRITFMNYFLFPNDTLRQLIDDYLYNRTVAPVHQQELDPRIFQGQEKSLGSE